MRRLLVAALLLGGAAPAAADDGLERLLARLEHASAQVESLRAEFTQRSRIKLFRKELRSSGRLLYQRPRRVRWEYLEPDPSTLVLDGDQASMRSGAAPPQLLDLARDPALRAVFDQLALWLGGGSLRAARTAYALSAGGSDEQPTLTLTPLPGTPAASTFARIELRFDPRLLLRAIALREVSGDDKEVTFTRMERNVALPATAFTP